MNEVEVFKSKVTVITSGVPEAKAHAGKIDCEGLIEFKKRVEDIVSKIKLMKVGYDTIEDFKALNTQLNKAATQIDSKRKEIEKEYNVPLTEYKNLVKELVSEIKNAREHIKEDLDKFEQEEIEMKREEFSKQWDTFGKSEAIPFSKIETHEFVGIENKKWYNKSTSKKSVLVDIVKINDLIENDIKSIKLFVESEKEQAAIINRYCQSLDLNKEIEDYKSWKKSIETIQVVEVVQPETTPVKAENEEVITTPKNNENAVEPKFEAKKEDLFNVDDNLMRPTKEESKPMQIMLAFTTNNIALVNHIESLLKTENVKYNIRKNEVR